MSWRKAGPLIVVAALVVSACGSEPTIARSHTPAGVPAGRAAVPASSSWLNKVVDHSVDASTILPLGDGAFVYGGINNAGELNTKAALLYRDKPPASFDTGVALADVTAAATESAVYLAGRRCADWLAERTDFGFSCKPGTITVLRVDLEELVVTVVDLGFELADPSGSKTFANIARFGAGVALDVSSPDRHQLLAISNEGKSTELPAPDGGFVCSSGSTLFADAGPLAKTPSHEVLPGSTPSSIATTDDQPGIVALAPDSPVWKPVKGAPSQPRGIRGCSHGYFFILPSYRGSRRVAILNAASLRWSTTSELAAGDGEYPIVNPSVGPFMVAGVEHYSLIDPERNDVSPQPPPSAPITGGPEYILSPDLQLLSVNSDLRLGEAS